MAEKQKHTRIKTPEFRVSFSNVLTPKAGMNDGKPKYSLVMMFPKSVDISAIQNLLAAAVAAEWPDATRRPPNLDHPIKDGDTDIMQDGTLRKDKYPEMAGHWCISASSVRKPGVVDQNVLPILEQEQFYSGCYAIATIHAFTYKPNKSNPQRRYGVALGLNNVQKTKDGDPFSGGAKPEEDFSPIGGGAPGGQVQQTQFDNMFSGQPAQGQPGQGQNFNPGGGQNNQGGMFG